MNNMPAQNVGGLLLDDIAEDFTKFKEKDSSVMTDLCKVKHSFNIRLRALLCQTLGLAALLLDPAESNIGVTC